MNYIIGSGLVAFLAKTILPKYTIIPTGKSRYYKFPVATCDDYIFCHKDIDEFIKQFVVKAGTPSVPVFFKRALSYYGQIIFGRSEGFLNSWLNKVYGHTPHPAADRLITFDGFVYSMSCVDLFKILEESCKSHFREFIKGGDKLRSIDTKSKIIYTNHTQLEYESIINTIPLDAMYKYCGVDGEFESKDIHTFVVETGDLNFEGASELLVVDDNIDFYKCTRVGKSTYQFFSGKEINSLSSYLNMFMNKYDILNATMVKKAIPLGDHKRHEELEQFGITSVGSNAQWDDFMDISSSIRRLMRLGNAP